MSGFAFILALVFVDAFKIGVGGFFFFLYHCWELVELLACHDDSTPSDLVVRIFLVGVVYILPGLKQTSTSSALRFM